MSRNRISNQLGGSTVAFSRDGHMLIIVQNNKNLHSANLLAPSGSGSFDWTDWKSHAPCDFLHLVERGAKREMDEECSLLIGPPIESRVFPIGFAQMVHRAGKPELICLGFINEDADEIRKRRPEAYVKRILNLPLPPCDFVSSAPERSIAAYLDNFQERNQMPLSVPLEHSLQVLRDHTSTELGAKKLREVIHTVQKEWSWPR
jgi:hypothetical protein